MERKRGFLFATLAILLALALVSVVTFVDLRYYGVFNLESYFMAYDNNEFYFNFLKPLLIILSTALFTIGLPLSLLTMLVSLVMGVLSVKKEKLMLFARILAGLSALLLAGYFLVMLNTDLISSVMIFVNLAKRYDAMEITLRNISMWLTIIGSIFMFCNLKLLLLAPVITLVMSFFGGKKQKAPKAVTAVEPQVEEQPVEEAPVEEPQAEEPKPKKSKK